MFEGRDHPQRTGPAGLHAHGAAPTIGGGRYAVVAKIAEGGMAGVYRAWDTKLHVWRAVKILLPEYTRRTSLRERFNTEAATMASLDHPHVVRVYDVVTDEALPFMVMELAEGGTLIGWLDAYGPMPPRLACEVVMQAARGLAAAHAAGVVHRDVKPHNVLVTLDGQCKVTDFGIARVRARRDGAGMTRTGSTMGTIGYMAPEQRSDAKGVDARADVYSLGAVLYKLLTGAIVTDLFLVEHEPELLDGIPQPLHEVILRACYHDRERRYATADALIAALEEIRVLLPPDPRDTAPLPILVEEATLEQDGGASPFEEIAVLLGEAARGTGAPPAERRVLPYRMPERLDRRKESTGEGPSYLDEQHPMDPEPSLRPAELQPPPNQRPVEPEEVAQPERTALSVYLLGAAAIGAWVVLALLGLSGTWEVRGRAEQATTARAALYEVISREEGMIHELRNAGGEEQRLARLYDLLLAFEAAGTEPARSRAAAAYVAALDGEVKALITEADSDRSIARQRAELVLDAYRDAVDARRAWLEATQAPSGRLATGLGLAPTP